jgi:hypothetical protein
VLAVDNLSGARVAGRTIRVDHVDNYKVKRAEVRARCGLPSMPVIPAGCRALATHAATAFAAPSWHSLQHVCMPICRLQVLFQHLHAGCRC